MKFFLLIVVVLCCILIGILIKNHYKRRYDFYNDLCSFCDDTKVMISYTQDKLEEIISKYMVRCKKDFNKFLKNYQKFLKNEISKEEFILFKDNNFLKPNEKEDISNFFLELGKMAKEEEVEKLILSKLKFEDRKKILDEENKKYSNMYLKLFVVLGFALFIIFL